MTTPARPVVPHRRTTLLWTLVVPLALTAAGTALASSWRAELPDPVASHWGADGVDGYSALLPLALGLAGTTLVFSLVMAAVGALAGQAAMTRRLACGVAVWFAAFMQVTLLTSLAPQRGLADASAAPSGSTAAAVGALVVTVVALAVALLVPGDAPQPATAPPPADARRLPLHAGESAAWVRRTGPGRPVLALAVALAPAVLTGVVGGQWWLAATIALGVGTLLVATLHWTVTVDGRGLTARSLLGVPRVLVPLDEVERADVVAVRPLADFGGWGVRTDRSGRTGVVVRGGDALEVHRTGGRRFAVTVPDAATGAALLNTLAARRAPAA